MKVLLGVVLMVVPSFWGCGAGQGSGGLSQRSDSLFTKDQIVASIPGEKQTGRYDLIWGVTFRTWNAREIFAAVHATDIDTGKYVASVYRRVDEAYDLVERLRSTDSRFDEPVFFRAQPEGTDSDVDLLAISEVKYGTGQLRREHVFRFEPDGSLEPVEFVPAWESFQPRLQPGEGIWADGENQFAGAGMRFVFYIWRDGDLNCCPTGGKVTGTYVLERNAGTYRIVAKSFERRPYRHPDAPGDG